MADGNSDPSRPSIPALSAEEKNAAEGVVAAGEENSVDLAAEEARQLSRGKTKAQLQAEAEENEHNRSQAFRSHFEKIAICALWGTAAAIAGIGTVWLFHMVAPMRLRWLSTEDLSHIQSIVTTGLLVGVISNHFRKRLG